MTGTIGSSLFLLRYLRGAVVVAVLGAACGLPAARAAETLSASPPSVQWGACNLPQPATQAPRPATLDDFIGAPRLTTLDLSPDGKTILLAQGVASEHNVYAARTDWWLIDADTGACRQLDADGEAVLSQPAWSPDSGSIAFVAAAKDGPRLWIVDTRTGAVQVAVEYATTDPKLGALSLAGPQFSPDGTRLGYFVDYLRNVQPGAPGGDDAKVVVATEDSGVFRFRTGDRFLEIVSLDSGEQERVTPSLSFSSADFSWSPEGTKMTLVPIGNAPHNRGYWRADPAVVDLATKRMRTLAHTPLADYLPLWSPDGERIAFLTDVPYSRFPLSRIRALRIASAGSDDVREIPATDLSISSRRPMVWSARGDEIYAAVNDHATFRVRAFPADGGDGRWVTPEAFHVGDFAVSQDGRTMAAIFENADTPADVYVGDSATGEFRRLTRFGTYWQGIALAQVEKVIWRSRDDRFDVEGWLFKPKDYVAGRRYPMLFHQHGGPGGVYMNGFIDTRFVASYHTPPELYANAGYAVLLINVRGDEGYGDAFIKAFAGEVGRGDVEQDLFGAVDAMVARGIADPQRLGILGHSYGAFASAWAIASSDRFAAASISDGLYDWWLFYNQTYLEDENWTDWFHFLLGCTPQECLDEYLARSPAMQADRIHTPTLMRVGTVGFSSMGGVSNSFVHARLIHRSLHQRHVPVELIIEPTQNHVIADEAVYRDWVDRNLDWFGFWLRGHEDPDTAKTGQYRRWREMRVEAEKAGTNPRDR